MHRQLHLVDRPPERLPARVQTSADVPRARLFETFKPHLRDAMDLLDRALDAAIGQARETDLAVRVMAAEIPPAAKSDDAFGAVSCRPAPRGRWAKPDPFRLRALTCSRRRYLV
jgi:hypothetical protein